ncbi:carboxyltransferase domain-containing protein [Devosia sp. FKR38]|uniref:5-oxoprolinase subunit B family protein n=1 Tax=Devosia sp. FKR38 TaxID=2562312 RepID=UPI001484CEE4|nr:carboxyltransferase domain-containing protein [Devosia sp. FKR38]
MTDLSAPQPFPVPTIVPLGDASLLVRFGTTLTEPANRAAIALARLLARDPVPDVDEVMPNLVSVLLRFDPLRASPAQIAGELRLRLFALSDSDVEQPTHWTIPAHFDGPDLDDVATALDLSRAAFIAAHNSRKLRVLATGFAPGFVYCGMHADALVLPRRTSVRPMVPAGTILFAAGQTAITATPLPTGWHVLGHTDFANLNLAATPPTRLSAGDTIQFTVAA